MLTLYVKSNCAFSAVVLKKVEDLGLTIEEKNIADPDVAAELLEKGGKSQVPYLIDSERGVALFESGAIAEYLEEQYGNADGDIMSDIDLSKIVLHKSDDADVCESCQ